MSLLCQGVKPGKLEKEGERNQRCDIDLGISALTENIEPQEKRPEEKVERDTKSDRQAAKALPTAIKLFDQSRRHSGRYSMGSPI